MVYSFFKYYIGCWSLVSKEWNENIITRLNFKKIRVIDSNLDLVLKWYKRGIRFKINFFSSNTNSILENLIISTKNNKNDEMSMLKDILGLFFGNKNRSISNLEIQENIDLIRKEIRNFNHKSVVYNYKESQHLPIQTTLEKLSIFRENVYRKQIKNLALDFERSLNQSEMNDFEKVLQEYHVRSLSIMNINLLSSINVIGNQLRKIIITSRDISSEMINSLVNNSPLLNVLKIYLITEEELGIESFLIDSIMYHSNIKKYVISLAEMNQHSETHERLSYFLNNNKSITSLTLGEVYITSIGGSPKPIHNNTIKSIHGEYIGNKLISLWDSQSALEIVGDNLKFTKELIEKIEKFHSNLKSIKQVISSIGNSESYPDLCISNLINRNLPSIKSINFTLSDHLVKSFDPTPIIQSLRGNTFIERINFGRLNDKLLPLKIVSWNLPNLRKVKFDDCNIHILEYLLKNDYIQDVNISVSGNVPDFAQILKQFLDKNQNIRKLNIWIPETSYSHQLVLDIFKNYYINHRSPIIPGNLVIGDFDNFILLKNRYPSKL